MEKAQKECLTCKYRVFLREKSHIRCENLDKTVKGSIQGIEQGNFLYPFDFDPVWKETLCHNYEKEKETEPVISSAPQVLTIVKKKKRNK